MTTTSLPDSNGSFLSTTSANSRSSDAIAPIPFVMHAIISYIIAAGGFIANSTIIIVILLSRSLRSTNMFMLFCNLATADFLLAVTIPFTGTIMLNKGYFYYGLFLCKAIPVIQTTVIIVSALTLVVVSIDRSLAIAKPFFFERWCSTKAIGLVISLIWIFSFTFASPQIHFLTLTPYQYCYIRMQAQSSITYLISGMIIQFFMPLVSGIVSYIVIGKVLRKLNQLPIHLQPNAHQLCYAKRRAKTAFIVLLVYILSSIGFYTLLFMDVALRTRFKQDPSLYFIMANISFVFRMIAYSSSVWNPFIYMASSPSFRQSIKSIKFTSTIIPIRRTSTLFIIRDSGGCMRKTSTK
ncbi:uncharacterized protein TRIADDRAFT_56127 [Trichoplax adhaerens]|uniref:G-protein coupled receptors family 1 profile domain-containing protein n=1 Tax=Trichoplax adhaerens TaxID=10228 RepID=B3RX93_TRIAD|nr:hypothetical protein TRIADDRAFT_56127 [Trichoplax adhaerens]EDV24830.1 hypothetical protein TRIADDRAFT_56127 [Trichoplax adhaerens]|eukprot:XP_002112720.1 hypothetical protein TRIADDRAFT_56127 [Trichoplax adhaerens]